MEFVGASFGIPCVVRSLMRSLCQQPFDLSLISIDGDAHIHMKNWWREGVMIDLHNKAINCIVSWQQFHTHMGLLYTRTWGPKTIENLVEKLSLVEKLKAIPIQSTIDHGGIRKQGTPNRWKTSMMENGEANHNNICDTTYYFISINFGQLKGIFIKKKLNLW